MKKKFIEFGFQFISKYEVCDELKEKKIKYGLEAIYGLVTKTVVLFIISFLLGVWREYLLLILIYSLARMYTFGIHAKSSLACWLTSIPIYIIGSLFIKYVIIPFYWVYIIWSFAFISFLLWAPADTPEKPLIHEEKRKKQKLQSCFICLIFLILLILNPFRELTNSICYALVIQSICINPFTYWITKTPYANYKIYLKKHGLNSLI